MKTIKILVADDHSVVRHGIINSLEAQLPDVEFEQAASASEILQLLPASSWDLAILDISLPGRNGLEMLREIKQHNPHTQVIIFSMYPAEQFAIRAIKLGASAYLTKNTPLRELAQAVKTIAKGEQYFSPYLTALITTELRNEHDKPAHQLLSNREYQVFELIASGLNLSDIARKLSLSPKTISVYRANILKKMNLKHNSEITHYAFKNQLIH